MNTTPARIVARIRKDGWDPEFPYMYQVDGYLQGQPDDPVFIDYGSVETRERAEEAVKFVLANRDQFDNADLVHTPGLR